MRTLVEVVDKPLSLRGPRFNVGERIWLDSKDPLHRAVLRADGWVRKVAQPPDGPPVDKMVHASQRKQAKPGKRQ